MITQRDLEMQFKSSTGFSKEYEPKKYQDWVENYLLDELNKEKDIEEFIINDCFADGE